MLSLPGLEKSLPHKASWQGFLQNWQTKEGAKSCVVEVGKDETLHWKRWNATGSVLLQHLSQLPSQGQPL